MVMGDVMGGIHQFRPDIRRFTFPAGCFLRGDIWLPVRLADLVGVQAGDGEIWVWGVVFVHTYSLHYTTVSLFQEKIFIFIQPELIISK